MLCAELEEIGLVWGIHFDVARVFADADCGSTDISVEVVREPLPLYEVTY